MSLIEWIDLFDDIFESYPDKWTLTSVHRDNTGQCSELLSQRRMERTGYARFHCPKCSNTWASAKAMVVLYYPHHKQSSGNVTLRFFGQQCRKCSRVNDYFVDPEFENDWIKLTLEKLHVTFGWLYYGEKKPEKKEFNGDKKNNITGPHESKLCEACRMGCCDQTRS